MTQTLEGRRILVTGGAGFLGGYLLPRLEKLGSEVIVVRRRNHDLTRQDVVEALLEEVVPEIVIHLAAEVGGIGANRSNPGRYFYANAMMGINLIEASRKTGVEKFVQVGTVCAYPKHTPVPFVEDDLWNGYPEETNAPYGVAKKSLWVMLDAYRRQYGLNGIYLLPANLYGPNDNFDPATSHVIPALIRKFVSARRTGAEQVEVWGTGAASREFLHADDAARAITLATIGYDGSDPVNVGAGQEVTIAELVELLADITGFGGSIVWNTDKPDGQPRRMLDVTRAYEAFDFEASYSLQDGLVETVRWWEEQPVG